AGRFVSVAGSGSGRPASCATTDGGTAAPDAVGRPTAPALQATPLGDYDTTALPAVFAVSAGNYQRTWSDFGGNPGPAPARRVKEQRRTRYSCDRRYRRKSFLRCVC